MENTFQTNHIVDQIYDETVQENGFLDPHKFAEKLIEECRGVILETYRKMPIELCGPLLTADEELLEHFYSKDAVRIEKD